MRVDKGDWFPIPLSPQREHLLQLDDAPDDRFAVPPELSFDFVTTETMTIVENTSFSEDELYDLHQYLENTNREAPEIIFGVADLQESQAEPNDDDKSDAATEIGDDEMHDEEDEESLVRHAVTNKLIKTLKLHQHMLEQKRRQTMDNVMKAHDGKILQFWEVYSGETRLAEAMQKKGYLVQTFDLFNGWDFTRADHRTAFSKLQYETCPDMMWLAPPCTKWSALQHLNCKIPADFEFGGRALLWGAHTKCAQSTVPPASPLGDRASMVCRIMEDLNLSCLGRSRCRSRSMPVWQHLAWWWWQWAVDQEEDLHQSDRWETGNAIDSLVPRRSLSSPDWRFKPWHWKSSQSSRSL